MDTSGKRCLSCGFNGDGHYSHCAEPLRVKIAEALKSLDYSLLHWKSPRKRLTSYAHFVNKIRALR